MENVYRPSLESGENDPQAGKETENFTPNLHQTKTGELVTETNSPKVLDKIGV
jgi:hypothetical protein